MTSIPFGLRSVARAGRRRLTPLDPATRGPRRWLGRRALAHEIAGACRAMLDSRASTRSPADLVRRPVSAW